MATGPIGGAARRLCRYAVACLLYRTGLFALWAWWRRRAGPPGVLVPFYHRLRTHRARPTGATELEAGVWIRRFESHLSVYRTYGRLMTLAQAARWLRQPTARGVVLAITFDDGYRDILLGLRRLLCQRAPCTVFPVKNASCGKAPLWWDELAARRRRAAPTASPVALEKTIAALLPLPSRQRAEELRSAGPPPADRSCLQLYLPPNVLQRLHRRGVELGGHTASHPVLTSEPPEKVRDELNESQQWLRELGASPTTFAYPNGRYNDRIVRLVRDAGFEVAVTTDPGANTAAADPLRWRRIPVGDEPADVVALRLVYYDFRDILWPHLKRHLQPWQHWWRLAQRSVVWSTTS